MKILKDFLKKFTSFKNLIAIYIMIMIPVLAKIGAPDLVLIILAGYLVGYLPTNFAQKKLFLNNKEDQEK